MDMGFISINKVHDLYDMLSLRAINTLRLNKNKIFTSEFVENAREFIEAKQNKDILMYRDLFNLLMIIYFARDIKTELDKIVNIDNKYSFTSEWIESLLTDISSKYIDIGNHMKVDFLYKLLLILNDTFDLLKEDFLTLGGLEEDELDEFRDDINMNIVDDRFIINLTDYFIEQLIKLDGKEFNILSLRVYGIYNKKFPDIMILEKFNQDFIEKEELVDIIKDDLFEEGKSFIEKIKNLRKD